MGDSILLKDIWKFELEDLWIEPQPSDEWTTSFRF